MQYSVNIDLMATQRWGLNVQQSVVFAYIYTCPTWCQKDPNDPEYFNISNGKLVAELETVSDKRDTMLRHVLKLVDLGVLQRKSINKKQYLKITEKGKTWNRKEREINPAQTTATGNKSRSNGKIIPQGTGNFSVESVNQLSGNQPSEKSESEEKEKPASPAKQTHELLNKIAALYNQHLPAHTKTESPQPINHHRQARIREIIRERPEFEKLEMWEWLFSGIDVLEFWNGRDKEKRFKRGFDYFLQAETFTKLYEMVDELEETSV